MQFVRVNNIMEGAQPLADTLISELEAHQRVLWLVPGGSNVPLSVAVMDKIPDELTEKLAIYLTDERFGPVGHPDSNIQQLINAGLNTKQATVVPVLVPAVGFTETVSRYEHAVKLAIDSADAIIGQFGIGGDGHIAGILPGSAAVDSKALVAGYETETFTRITLTFKALERLSIAYAYAFGDSKLTALTNLQTKDLPLSEQPSQILKQIPKSYVYSDQIQSS